MNFEGKTVIVTGAARGLGRDYARFFSEDQAAVAVADVNIDGAREVAKEIEHGGGRALAVEVDVTDAASTAAMADAVRAAFGSVDVLVNNAAIWGDLQSALVSEVDPSYWDLVMAVNLKGPLLCSRAVAPAMREQRSGRIINISSMGAYMRGGVYSVSKMALNQLTFQLAADLGDHGITVNAVAPGGIDNEATQRQVSEAAFAGLVKQNIIKRAGTSRDLYGMIRYLASEDAEWVTGQTFLVNGGFNTRF